MDIVSNSRELMRQQTDINKAPSWLLTELAVKKWRELAARYNTDEKLVVVSLYLAHTVFDPEWKWEVQKHHPKLSAAFVKPYLNERWVSQVDQNIILNAIEAHHNHIPTQSLIAEIVKNAECYKFITVEGSLIRLHELWLRWISLNESVEKVIQKMEQKKALLTLDACKAEAEESCREILRIFKPLYTEK